MKDKLYYNFVNSLIAIGILTMPISILIYILYDTKLVKGYFNHFNILVYGLAVCVLSFVLYFVLSRLSSYKRIQWKLNEANDDFVLALDNLNDLLSNKMKELGYRESNMPGYDRIFINEQLLQSGKIHSKVIHVTDYRVKANDYIKKLDAILRKYYIDNNIGIEAITGVVCFESNRVKKKNNMKDYFNYDAAKSIVSHYVICIADVKEKRLYFNNENISGKRTYPLKMIKDIFGKEN